ncbi:hypothetical protein Pan258_57990 [Symmachiella dynata]|uniref:hypothetical protein n=1 Tax=Symmachiella dynata TaxID=2527995 RepID=UPI00118D3B36|nr:hypothetical protein [Symmachiella dynata]QDT51707.1 hypothetical protein Pan258_57990 [Symmachiella dynata]
MPKVNRIKQLLQPSQRFARSIHLERDFSDSTALNQYVVTDRVGQLVRRFASAFSDGSTERAWRITGDYGTGKSCFALALARLCDPRSQNLPKQLHALSKAIPKANAIPVLITGAREPISEAIIRAVTSALEQSGSKKRPDALRLAKRVLKEASPTERDRYAIDLLESTTQFISATKQCNGVILILDELGKSLEFATQHPDEQDITFLQTLAETASRSGDNPLVVLGILHQGFSAYADKMESNDQREWDKIGGRFEELTFDQPLEQLVSLVASALGVKVNNIPPAVKRAARENMGRAIDLGWFGAVNDRTALMGQAPSIFPLQPMLLPVLVKFFSRFGQNERSLFSFLYSADTNALRSFAEQHDVSDGFFGIHHLYDFVRSSIGNRLHTRALSSRWSQIESVIESSLGSSAEEVAMLKTVGVLNMLDDLKLTAQEDSLTAALEKTCLPDKSKVGATLKSLRSKKRVLYYRGSAGGYCLWPYTSVNLELKYAEAEKVVRKDNNVVDAVTENVVHRPIVARRHYVTTGNLRYFDLVYVKGNELESAVESWDSNLADGVVFVPLCQTTTERARISQSISKLGLRNRPGVLVAVPKPLSDFSGLVAEVRRWEWVLTNVPELNGDKHGREEATRQIDAARAVLLDRINQVLDVRSFRGGRSIDWYHKGKTVDLGSSRELFRFVSDVCDTVFDQSPVLRNELLNRRKLSSAAAAARMRLIERILDNATEEFLGMDASKKPPEMSMYLSALKQTNLHVTSRKGSRIAIPSRANDTCKLIPLFDHIRSVLTKKEGNRVLVSDLFAELRKPPIGARDGILPLVLAVFCVAESQHVAIYEDDVFLHEIGGAEFHRLSKVPESFELQYCKLSGVRSEVFNQLLSVVGTDIDDSRAPDLIDVVRPLCEFAAGLPDYSRNTTSLSKKTLAVREALLDAREPSTLIFEQLPTACGQSRIPVRKKSAAAEIKKYVKDLKKSLGELRSAYPSLLGRIEKAVASAFEVDAQHDKLRKQLEKSSTDLGIHVTEPTLKAFCLRLADTNLGRDAWLESVGSLVLAKPPRRWHDTDAPRFEEALVELVIRFQKTACLAFAKGKATNGHSMRIGILKASGVETSCVVEVPDTKQAAALKRKMERLFDENPGLAIAVASQVMLTHLPNDSKD